MMEAWGKFDESSGRIHRLEHHCADVAACFEALLCDPVLRARFVRAAGANGVCDTIAARLTFLAFLHDFGKLNTGFQFKVTRPNQPSRTAPRPAGHIAEALLCFDQSDICELLGLHEIVDEWGAGVICLLHAMLAHHGRPARRPTQSGGGPPELWKPFAGYDPRATAKLLRQRGRAWFPDAFRDGPPMPDVPALAHLFAGVVALADQLGSDEDAFEYEPDPDPHYVERARRITTDAVRGKGFRRFDWSADAAVADVGMLFDYQEPRPSQRAVSAAPLDRPLLILESETGSGKTETAVLRFAALWRAGLVDGLYFAVPTRAAAKQLHSRVRDALDRLLPPAATLHVWPTRLPRTRGDGPFTQHSPLLSEAASPHTRGGAVNAGTYSTGLTGRPVKPETDHSAAVRQTNRRHAIVRARTMSDKTAIITAVVAGTAVLLTVTVALHNSTRQQIEALETSTRQQIEALETSTNRQIDALNQSLSTRINDLNTSVNRRIDDLGTRVDDLAERTIKVENDVREVRTLLIDRLGNQADDRSNRSQRGHPTA